MNEIDLSMLGKQVGELQAAVRKLRAEVSALNLRFNLLETRLGAIDGTSPKRSAKSRSKSTT